jgi:hypothetical protein
MSSKHRQFCIVIHNVRKEIEDIVNKHNAQKAKESILSVEPYPEGDGQHLHLYIQYPNPRYFKSVLNEYEQLAKRLIEPKPIGEERAWGRVQVDVMRGRFDQAEAYLEGETKDKPTGQIYKLKKKPCCIRQRYTNIKDIGNQKQIESFCRLCTKTDCPGCCPGCWRCDENIPLRTIMDNLLEKLINQN